MLFNTAQGNDPRSFFYYNGDYYINGTEIILTDRYVDQNQFNGKKLWKYARYDHQTVCNGKISYFFCITKCDWFSLNEMGIDAKVKNDYAPYFTIEANNLPYAIDQITKPIKLERAETDMIMAAIVEQKHDWDNAGLMLLWLVYIIAMVSSLIFRQFYLIWIVITCVFYVIRKGMLS